MVHYLSDRHKELSGLSRGIMLRWFDRLDATGRNTLVGGFIGIGVLAGAGALMGRMSPTQYFCIQMPVALECADNNGRAYQLSSWHWEKWARDGRPAEIVPHPTMDVVPASNPYKPFWALISLLSFGAAASAIRILQSEAGELAVYDDLAVKRGTGLADMAARADMIAAMTPVAVAQADMEAEVERILAVSDAELQVVRLETDADVEIARFEAEQAVMARHLADVPDDQKEGVIRAFKLAKGLQTPYRPQLDGDTLDSIADPSDKVGGQDPEQIESPATTPTLMEEDIAQTIANAPPDAHMNVAIAGESGSGKTSVTLNALKAKHDKEVGMIDLQIFNGKPEADVDWGGLRASSNDYMAVNTPERALDMVYKFKSLHRVLTGWQDGDDPEHAPMLALFDEVNNQRLCIPKVKIHIGADEGSSLAELKGTQQAKDAFDETMKLFITQCRSERSGCWIMTHSYLVENIGLDRQLQSSFSFIILGRASYELIAGAIRDAALISSAATRERLREQYEAVIPLLPPKTPIALTNVDGPWRLVRLPRYEKQVFIARGPLNQSAREIADADAERAWAKAYGAAAEASPKLNERQQAILEFGRENRGLHTPSEIQARVWACRGVKAAELAQDFAVLQALNFGSTEKTSRSVKWGVVPDA